MKRIISLLALLSVLLSLIGCQSRNENHVSFYYCRQPSDQRYFEEGVICAEDRDMHGYNGNLRYAIGLYLAGPMEEGLRAPLPQSVKLLSVERTLEAVALTFSDLDTALTDAEFTIACACLTLTCADLTGCRQVTVISGDRSLTMTSESFRFMDSVTPETTEGD